MESDYELIKSLVPEDIVGQVIIRIGDYKRSKRPNKTEPSIIMEDPFEYTFKSKKNSVVDTI